MSGAGGLDDALANRRWLLRSDPFPHVVARHVFRPEVYAGIEAGFRDLLDRVLGRSYLEDHDIHGTTVTAREADRFGPLLTRGWHDMLTSIFDVQATGQVLCGLHHHKVGSNDSFPHNDLNLGWFGGEAAPGQIELSSPHTVDYLTGKALADGATPVAAVRAVAMIFYLANPPWSVGDGGVTGVYRKGSDPVHRPALRVPPVNNSLFAFECTPRSYHGFIGNRRHPRNSIVLWLHRPKEVVTARWGEGAIVPYGLRPRAKAR